MSNERKRDDNDQSPSTNDDGVPRGLEGSIKDDEQTRHASGKPDSKSSSSQAPRDRTDERAEGDDRRIDDL